MGSADACQHMIGSVVKVRVVSADPSKHRIQLSMRLTTVGLSTPTAAEGGEAVSLAPGTLVTGSIAAVLPGSGTNGSAVVRVMSSEGKTVCHGTLSLLQCADSPADAETAFAQLKPSKRTMCVLTRGHCC